MPELRLRGGEVDGLAINYLVEGRGPAVVLLHGLGSFAESWRHNIPSLAARASVYTLDLPGFGRSAKPPAGYSLAYFARALHAFLDGVGVTQVSLVGHSLGAAVAVTYALMHPSRVERLALLAACVPGFNWRPGWRARVVSTPGIGELLGLCVCAPLYRAAIAKCFHAPPADEVEFLVRWEYAERTGAAARAAWLATVRSLHGDFVERRADYRRAVATLDLPVLLVHGRQDIAVPAGHCAHAADGFARATVRWLDACGHFPHIEHAQVVNAWLADFLVGRPAPR
ncbi:MAG TPA: alpha/beta fold hydrolase [Methylomirabilota bacterium]|jgi:pimeloyl-ACP methyl ester carboxylesterase|nr:alpha/beta fold hydrolase [Methylomirabilota bacterium]